MKKEITIYINCNPLPHPDITIVPYEIRISFGECLMNIIGTTKEGYICCLPYKVKDLMFFDENNRPYKDSSIRAILKSHTKINFSKNLRRMIVPVTIEECPDEQELGFLMSLAEANAIQWSSIFLHSQQFWTRTRVENGDIIYLKTYATYTRQCTIKPNAVLGYRPIYLIKLPEHLNVSCNTIYIK
jgi:hypothetical protein